MQATDPKLRGFSTFLQLERSARHAESVEALGFIAVNETRRLLNFRQAVLAAGGETARPRVQAVSGVSVLERDAPFVRWTEAVLTELAAQSGAREVRRIGPDEVSAKRRSDWDAFAGGHALWVPLIAPDGEMLGALWMTREAAWSDGDLVLAERLADCYAHAWRALAGRKAGRRARRWPKVAAAAAVVGLLGALAIPVPQSALAPAEVVAAKPRVVAAPMDGVIARVHVAPNQSVEAGQKLFSFDATELESQAAVARRALAIAEAELRRASQGAFADREETAKLRVLETKRDLRAAELAQAEDRLSRVTVTAEQPGVAIFTDPNEWGRAAGAHRRAGDAGCRPDADAPAHRPAGRRRDPARPRSPDRAVPGRRPARAGAGGTGAGELRGRADAGRRAGLPRLRRFPAGHAAAAPGPEGHRQAVRRAGAARALPVPPAAVRRAAMARTVRGLGL
ncbi:MAG: biotin/lipoyl-binding protein [Rhodovibrio sp.]|nr:biotin/lipoyl-binding protein [Rhodovibrio sp.]